MSITSERIRENDFIHPLLDDASDEIEKLEAENEALRKDAERYLWLAAYLIGSDTIHDDYIVAANSKGELDTVIDAARGVK